MKKVFLFFGLIMALVSQAQFPSTITSGNSSTLQKANGAFGSAIGYVFAGTYGDTTAANVSFIKNVPGIVIRIGDDLWIRNNASTAWIKIGFSSIPSFNQVTSVGNITSNDFSSTDYGGDSTAIKNGSIEMYYASGASAGLAPGYIYTGNSGGTGITWHSNNEFGFGRSGTGNTSIRRIDPVGSVIQYFQGKNGTIALLSDISDSISAHGSGSGTVNTGTQYRLGYYATTGTALSEAPAITGSRALVSDANGVPTHSATTATQIGYLSTTTSDVQTQINSKEATFTTTTEDFTGSTSVSITVAHTIKAGKAVIVYYNGLPMLNSAVSATPGGTTVTLTLSEGRLSTDNIKIEYPY
jgi:hypothetical protein